MNRWIAKWVFLLLLLPLPLAAEGIVNLVVDGKEVRAGIALPLNIRADLKITFEQVEGLTAESIGLSATLANLTDPELLSRLQSASIPGALPMLLRIHPPEQGGLSFQGVVTIEIHTHLLPFTLNTPLRLFAASEGGRFQDITANVGMGSFRCRGRKGGFSEFLILADLRPANWAIAQKLDRVDEILEENEAQIAAPVLAQLTDLAAAIRNKQSKGQTQAAITKTEEFVALVEAQGSSEIPDTWRASGELTNVAGQLRAAGETLRFSLIMKAQSLLGGLL